EEGQSEGDLNLAKAKMRAIRAYANMKLFAYFTPDYTNPGGLSIIKLDFLQTDDYERYEGRSSVQEIVSFIEEDAEYALSGTTLQDKAVNLDQENEVNAYIFKSFVYAVVVKLYAMTGNTAKLNDALTAIESQGYSLATPLQYSLMFEQDNKELNKIPE